MNRREALVATASTVAALSMSALADTKPAAKGADKPAAAPTGSGASAALVQAAQHCVATGKDCIDHCVRMLSTGDTSMAECIGTARQMLPLCEAVAELARQKSPHLKALAAVCAKACRECEAACKKHSATMAECKACMESCAACATECEKIAA